MPRPPALLVLDAGTSAVRALAYDRTGRIVALHTYSVTTSRPQPNRAEMDPEALLQAVDQVLGRTMADLDRLGLRPRAMGLAVQRSSFLVYEPGRKTALTPLLTWQDIRADELLGRYRTDAAIIGEKTGLLLAPYYGGPKFAWLLEHRPELRVSLTAGRAFFVPLETLIIHHLTGNLLIDETIAGRTLMYDIGRRRWDPDLLALFGLDGPLACCLPELVPSQYDFGRLNHRGRRWPLMVCQGDQQAAMAGLGARAPGTAAINYGTSGSVLVPTGDHPVRAPGLLAGPAFTSATNAEYLLEGTINAVGALFRWFEEDLGQPGLARRWPTAVAPRTGLVLIPGLNGLAAPYWRADVATTFLPSRRGYSVGQQLRAGMESITHLVADIVDALPEGVRPAVNSTIHCGGGMARPALLQFQADLIQRQIWQHRRREATAWGVALRLAQVLEWDDFGEAQQTGTSRYEPVMSARERKKHRERWQEGVRQALGR
ncbi:MAG: FGGY family carbohydrate kinase [Candidatus Neomarinimicrobiota bacterium]